jgi:oxygen-dependent protoporphyrinogen oxidase
MGRLPERLAEELKTEIRFSTRIASVEPLRGDNGTTQAGWKIRLWSGEETTTNHLILAVPAYLAAELLQVSATQLAAELKAIEYAPMLLVSSAYDRSQVTNRLDGFGFMVPRREGLRTICTFWNSSLFGERAPQGKVVITSFAGRELNDTLETMPEDDGAQAVEAENARILGITGKAEDRQVWREAKALPQYNVGHKRRVAEISRILSTQANLHLAGNYLRGRSIGECVEVGYAVAENLNSQLEGQGI